MSDSEKLQGQVAELESSISSLVESHQKGTKIAGIIAVVAPLVVIGYFSFIWWNVKQYTEPQSLVDMGMAQLDHRGGVAAAHAGRAQHADMAGIQPLLQRLLQRFRPASSQDSESQTRMVSAGGGVSPSFTTSKCA